MTATALGTVASHRSVTTTGPIPMTGLTAWWDADDASTFTLGAGSTVQQWRSKGGAGHIATPTFPEFAPPRTGTLNGHPVVSFNVNMLHTDWSYLAPVQTTFITFTPRAFPSGDNRSFLLGSYGHPSSYRQTWMRIYPTGDLYPLDTPYGPMTGPIPLSLNQPVVCSYVYNVPTEGVMGPWETWKNGSSVGSGQISWSMIGDGSFDIGAGGNHDNPSFAESNFVGDIAEIIQYNRALSTPERQQVETYLSNKWTPFNPLTSIPWHAAYWASDPAWTPPADGTAVATWRDGSGNGRDMAAAGAPLYRAASTLNGKPAVEVSPMNGLKYAPISFTPPWEVFIVFKPGSTTGENYIVSAGTSSSYGNSFGKLGGNWRMEGNSFFDGTAVTAGAHSARALWSYPSGSHIIVDGAVLASGGAPNNIGDSAITWEIGAAKFNNQNYNWASEVAFVGFKTSALTTQEAANLEAWSRSFYGTP